MASAPPILSTYYVAQAFRRTQNSGVGWDCWPSAWLPVMSVSLVIGSAQGADYCQIIETRRRLPMPAPGRRRKAAPMGGTPGA